MEFKFETVYDQKAFTAMARALRKTVRKKKSQRSHIFGWIVIVIALLLCFLPADSGFALDARTVATLLVVVIMVVALIWEDALNGYVALKRTLPGMSKSNCVFREDGYCSTTEMGKTEWSYDKPVVIAETEAYFVFIFSASHAQLYDKKNISGGSVEAFRTFIEDKTGKKLQMVK